MNKKFLIVGLVVFFLLTLDQVIKVYVKTSFESTETIALIGDWFILHYIENPGMAFGTTFGSEIWHKLALSILRVVAIIFIAIYIFK